MKTPSVQAHAKINLFLAIRGRRPDGYHDLDMLNVQASLADRLTFEDSPKPGIAITCDDPAVPVGSGNLVWRAAELLLGEPPAPGISIHIEKRIPVGAGLGGGSSDAAVVLRTLNRLRQCGQDDRLSELAASIGSDVPYSLVGGLCRCRGRGERIEPLTECGSHAAALGNPVEPWLYILLIFPPLAVHTADAYGWWDTQNTADLSSPDRLMDALRSRDSERVSATLHNSFDSIVPSFVPAIAQIKEAVKAAIGRKAQLAGSGSSLFLVGGGLDELEEARDRLSRVSALADLRYEISPLLV